MFEIIPNQDTPTQILMLGRDGVCCNQIALKDVSKSLQDEFGYTPQKEARYHRGQAVLAYERENRETFGKLEFVEPSTEESPNDEIVTAIVAEYNKTHTYSMKDLFVCLDMACDVWNQVTSKGINARIQGGSISKQIKTMFEADHAWVIAEVTPGKWLALETTGGYVVRFAKQPRYYVGHAFANPRETKDFEALRRQYGDALSKEIAAIESYNQAVSRYNTGYGSISAGYDFVAAETNLRVREQDRKIVEAKLRRALRED